MSEGIISWSRCERVPGAGIMAGWEACPKPPEQVQYIKIQWKQIGGDWVFDRPLWNELL